MQIPVGSSGFPTVSVNQIRTYGAGGFRLIGLEDPRGCPRLYKAKYVERRVREEETQKSPALRYGGVIHEALFLMEEEGIPPEEALERVWPIDMDQSFWSEAREDLEAYISRGATPRDRFATLAVELDAECELYVDEEFGPIWFRGILDLIALDPDQPSVLHVVDYKTNRTPPKVEDVKADVQMRAYAWLALRIARERFGIDNPTVVVHLDAVKWREYEVHFTHEHLEDWYSWFVAVVRTILRDEEAKPRLHDDCAYCPVRHDCPAFEQLPDTARTLGDVIGELEDPVSRLQWRDAANKVRLLLDKAVKAIDAEISEQVRRDGVVTIGDTSFVLEPSWINEIDLQSLHRALGDRFYDLVTTSKTKIEEATKGWPVTRRADILASIRRVPSGTTVSRKEAPRE